MTHDVVAWVGLVVMSVLGVSVLGAVERRERYAFVLGVGLVLGGLTALAGTAAGLVALLGLAVVAASTVPMLRE